MKFKGLRWSLIAGAENGWAGMLLANEIHSDQVSLKASGSETITPSPYPPWCLYGQETQDRNFWGECYTYGCVRERGCHWGSSITSLLSWDGVSRWTWSSSTGHTGCPSREPIIWLQKHSVEALTLFLSKEGYFLVTLYVPPWNQKSFLLTFA